jgi:N-acetylglucosamine-6-phosphate deacetylase
MNRISGRIVTPDGIVNGVLSWDGDTITAVRGAARAAKQWIVPGFVDIHVHGGGGHSFTTGDADAARRAAGFHAARGTTTLLASLVSSPIELMRKATEAFAPLVHEGVLAGIHFEGPYLAAACCGAQNPLFLRDPSLDEVRDLVAIGGGVVRMMTIAPELPGALDAIRFLASEAVVPAIGHTDATYDETMAGIAAGARVATHLFNGMRPPHHRTPGPAYALLGSRTVVCELVADGHHLHDGTLVFAAAAGGPSRTALVTDALAPAGLSDGSYELGGQAIEVTGGVARLAGNGAIAGSTLTMAAAFRRAVSVGIPITDAAAMAATTPARVIGLGARLGALSPGLRADAVVLDDDLAVRQVLHGGRWLDAVR